jgi:ribosome-binding ATPase
MLIGIVGAPNSGKSTFFKSVTLNAVEIANYPFTTIKPNQGVGYVTTECPCQRLGVECSPVNSKCVGGTRLVPVKLLDVAGLVPGAHEGKGMGNQFLGDLATASGLIHVLDSSGRTNSEGKPEEGWDPRKTIEMLEHEIDEWLKGIIAKSYDKIKKEAEANKVPIERPMAAQLSGLGITEDDLKTAMKKASPEEIGFATALRQCSKPIMVAANKADTAEAQELLPALKGDWIVPCSAESELALREADKAGLVRYIPGSGSYEVKGILNEKQEQALGFIRSNVLEKLGSTGIQQVINSLVFQKMRMIVVYPVANITKLASHKGNVLPDAYLVPDGTTLKELAYKIHTQFGDNFIGGLDLKKRKIGADYKLKHGDIVEILFKG